jgi:Protein of unknown function (DUF3102)
MTLALLSPSEQRILALVEEFKATFRRTLALAVELGGALEDHKATLPHGAWLLWVETNFELGQRMAQRFMELKANASDLTHLPPDTSVDAAVKWLTERHRTPRPPPVTSGLVSPPPTLYRYMIDQPTPVVVRAILGVCFPDAATALDPTYGNGGFWDGQAPLTVTCKDALPSRAPHGTCDVRALVEPDDAVDVVLFDPPHLADGGEDSVMADRFGTLAGEQDLRELIMQGTAECWRVAALGIVVKVCDHVHGQRLVQETEWVAEAMNYGMPYEVVHQVRTTTMKDPRWGDPLSAYTNGSTYMVWRTDGHIHRR